MGEKYNLTGKNYSDEEREATEKGLEYLVHEARGVDPDELEKTPLELEIIQTCKDMLRTTLSAFGIDKKLEINADQIHIYPPEKYPDRENKTIANVAVVTQKIEVKRRGSKTKMIAALLHEMIHLASDLVFYSHVSDVDGLLDISDAKSGYRLHSEWKTGGKHKFVGLNEAITDILMYRILKKNEETLKNQFRISISEEIISYTTFWDIVKKIIDKIAIVTGSEFETILDDYIRAQFTGEMMHLRDIERLYGKGSLQVLALLGYDETLTPLIQKYFETDSEKERKELFEQLKPHLPILKN